MKNKLLKDVIVPQNRGIIVLCLIIIRDNIRWNYRL